MIPRPNILIVLTLPGPVAQRYREALTEALPDCAVHFADNQETAGPFIGEADALVTFGPMVSDQVFAQAKKLRNSCNRWALALMGL